MPYNRFIACIWIIAAAWVAWGVTSQAWSGRPEDLRTNPGWLITSVLVLSVFTAFVGYAVLRGRRWAIWPLKRTCDHSLTGVRRFNLRPVEQVARDEEHIRSFLNGFSCDECKRVRKIFVRKPPIQPAAAKVDVCGVKDLHCALLTRTQTPFQPENNFGHIPSLSSPSSGPLRPSSGFSGNHRVGTSELLLTACPTCGNNGCRRRLR